MIAIDAVPLDGELRDASVQGIASQRLQGIGVVEHFLRRVHQALDGVLALRRLVGKHDGGLIEVWELCLVTLGLIDSDLHTRFQQEVKLTHCLAVHTDSPALQCQLDLVATLLDIF